MYFDNGVLAGSMPVGADDGGDALVATLSLLSKKWIPEIVRTLHDRGPLGYSELEAAVSGISAKVLSQRLDTLIEADVVSRTVISESPLRVEYTLSEGGKALETVFETLDQWGERYLSPERPTLVVADEDRRFTALVKRWFEPTYTVHRVHDREELLEAFDDRTTVLLYDTHLPGTGNFDIRTLAKDPSTDCRFVALRTNPIGPSVLDLECDIVIRKPLSKAALRSVIETQVARYGEASIDREFHSLIEKRDALQANVSASVLEADDGFTVLEQQIEQASAAREDN